MSFFRWQQQTLMLYCHLQPNASCDQFAGLYNGRLKIRLRAPPLEGKANKALIRFIANAFAVPRADVTLVSGTGSRQKTLAVYSPQHIPDGLDIQPPADTPL